VKTNTEPLPQETVYIGIDNGLDGGVACVAGSGDLKWLYPMPVLKKGKGREVDIQELVKLLFCEAKPFVAVEEASKQSAGVLALCSTWYTYGQIIAALKLYQLSYCPVYARSWQKHYFKKPKMPKGQKFDTKAAALQKALQLWPRQSFLKSERCTKPHDGMVDAALIAHWARTHT
jgi:hypothetical protein